MATGGSSDRYLPAGWVLPEITTENRVFFTAGQMLLQHCARCNAIQHPPGEFCFSCQSLELRYVPHEPDGTVVAVTVVHHAAHPMLEAAVPYNVVVVELADAPGVRIVGNVVGSDDADVAIGLAVTAEWAEIEPTDDGDETIRLLQWRAR